MYHLNPTLAGPDCNCIFANKVTWLPQNKGLWRWYTNAVESSNCMYWFLWYMAPAPKWNVSLTLTLRQEGKLWMHYWIYHWFTWNEIKIDFIISKARPFNCVERSMHAWFNPLHADCGTNITLSLFWCGMKFATRSICLPHFSTISKFRQIFYVWEKTISYYQPGKSYMLNIL